MVKKLLFFKLVLTSATLTAAAFGAYAQTSTNAPMGSTQTPAAVGVTPQAATDANRKAVPRSDTGTVVRTSPNAADSARAATGTGNGSMSGGSMSGNTASGSTSSGMPGNTRSTRVARADRN